jgi:hypothetical protein
MPITAATSPCLIAHSLTSATDCSLSCNAAQDGDQPESYGGIDERSKQTLTNEQRFQLSGAREAKLERREIR